MATWSRDQRNARVLATLIGAVIGVVLAASKTGSCVAPYRGSPRLYFLGLDWSPAIAHCWLVVLGPPILVGALAYALVVVLRLMKN